MGKVKQSNIKNETYYFCNDQINWKDFDIYYIGYMTFKKIANCNNINSINPLYLMINEMIGHFEEKNNTFLVLNDIYENKEVLENVKKFGSVLKQKLKLLMEAKKLNMGKIFKNLSLSLMMICH